MLRDNPMACMEYQRIRVKDHQAIVCHHIMHKHLRRLLVFHSVGTGKTLTALTAIRCILERHPQRRVYVVVPKMLQGNMQKNMQEHVGSLRTEQRARPLMNHLRRSLGSAFQHLPIRVSVQILRLVQRGSMTEAQQLGGAARH